MAQNAEQPQLEGHDLVEILSSDQGADSAVATKAVSSKVPELLAEIGYDQKKALADMVEMTRATKVEIGWTNGVICRRKSAPIIPLVCEPGLN